MILFYKWHCLKWDSKVSLVISSMEIYINSDEMSIFFVYLRIFLLMFNVPRIFHFELIVNHRLLTKRTWNFTLMILNGAVEKHAITIIKQTKQNETNAWKNMQSKNHCILTVNNQHNTFAYRWWYSIWSDAQHRTHVKSVSAWNWEWWSIDAGYFCASRIEKKKKNKRNVCINSNN